jgi:hypothetical protein
MQVSMWGGRRGFGEPSELREGGELFELGELGIRCIFGKINDESKFYNKNDCILKTFAKK